MLGLAEENFEIQVFSSWKQLQKKKLRPRNHFLLFHHQKSDVTKALSKQPQIFSSKWGSEPQTLNDFKKWIESCSGEFFWQL